jgi:hypothetical protein
MAAPGQATGFTGWSWWSVRVRGSAADYLGKPTAMAWAGNRPDPAEFDTVPRALGSSLEHGPMINHRQRREALLNWAISPEDREQSCDESEPAVRVA